MPKINYEAVLAYFLNSDIDIQDSEYQGREALVVQFMVGKRTVSLIHICENELVSLPHFFLMQYESYGDLAHVLPVTASSDLGSICVNDRDSVSVNFDRPELAFEESIKRHIDLISRVLLDPEWNESETLREFQSNWNISTRALKGENLRTVYCSPVNREFALLNVFSPELKDSIVSIPASFVTLPEYHQNTTVGRYLAAQGRSICETVAACVLPLTKVNTVLPKDSESLKLWLYQAFLGVEKETWDLFGRQFATKRSKQFWLVLNIETLSGLSWFGVQVSHNKKKPFPLSIEKSDGWKVEPISVHVLSEEHAMTRGGADYSMHSKNVLLVGCGSVGSEIAHKICSSGVGKLTLLDPDVFSISNIYRHTLSRWHTFWLKSVALAGQLKEKYPFVDVLSFPSKLLDIRDPNILQLYDLVIVAIGAPTHERIFYEYILENKVNSPVVYTWLEGYGVGGHAVLDLPRKKGCLRCAYVDPVSGGRGLASNLNFLQSDQNIVKNYAGCGEMFIPYGAISSTQTALIAADLAVTYLSGKTSESLKVSWKGDSTDADSEGLKFTDRYERFNSSLVKQPLLSPFCDSCSDSEPLVFERKNLRVCIPRDLQKELNSYRQVQSGSVESAGLLIGSYKSKDEIWIHQLTTPKPGDIQKKSYYKLDASAHQLEVDKAFVRSEHLLGYIGTWHTHPGTSTKPSPVDMADWFKHKSENPDRRLLFIIVGTSDTSVFMLKKGKVKELQRVVDFVEGDGYVGKV